MVIELEKLQKLNKKELEFKRNKKENHSEFQTELDLNQN